MTPRRGVSSPVQKKRSRQSESNPTAGGDPRLALVDSLLRRLWRLAAHWGVTPAQLNERLEKVTQQHTMRAQRLDNAGQTARTYQEVHASAEILRIWCQEIDFVDSQGKPKKLKMLGPSPNFVELVARATRGVDPQTALQDLVAAGAVVCEKDGTLTAENRLVAHKVAWRLAEEGLYAADNLLASVERNVAFPHAKDSLQCEAVCLRFDEEELPRIRRYLRQQCLAALEQTDDWLHQHTAEPDDPPAKGRTVAVGLYITVRN
jgi:Family of unknown function (DUF6502)